MQPGLWNLDHDTRSQFNAVGYFPPIRWFAVLIFQPPLQVVEVSKADKVSVAILCSGPYRILSKAGVRHEQPHPERCSLPCSQSVHGIPSGFLFTKVMLHL